MILKLSDTKVGTPSTPTEWNNRLQNRIPQDPKKVFLNRLQTKHSRGNEGELTENLDYRADNLLITEQYQSNYLEYLENCWGDHLGVVITPDNIWYTLLCELAEVIKGEPEKYRYLFSETKETQEIIVFSGDPVVMPLASLIDVLKDTVPTDINLFLPKFSTTTDRSQHAYYSAFCDICSPYYNYGMLLCSIPLIDIRGDKEDWQELANKWKSLSKIINTNKDWINKVQTLLDNINENFLSVDFWKSIFYLKHCGSGGQVEVYGWWTDLFLKQPNVRYSENFSTHVSKVNYKQLNFDKNYQMKSGLFTNKLEGEFMVPDYGYIVYEKVKEAVKEEETDSEEPRILGEKEYIDKFPKRIDVMEVIPEDQAPLNWPPKIKERLAIIVNNPTGVKSATFKS